MTLEETRATRRRTIAAEGSLGHDGTEDMRGPAGVATAPEQRGRDAFDGPRRERHDQGGSTPPRPTEPEEAAP